MRGLLGVLRNPRHPIRSRLRRHSRPRFAQPRACEGHEGNSLIVDNAELLKAQSIARITETVDIVDGAKKMTPALRHTIPAGPADETGAMHASAPDGATAPASALHLNESSALVAVSAAAQP